jgi:hypothetical protein
VDQLAVAVLGFPAGLSQQLMVVQPAVVAQLVPQDQDFMQIK